MHKGKKIRKIVCSYLCVPCVLCSPSHEVCYGRRAITLSRCFHLNGTLRAQSVNAVRLLRNSMV